MNPFTDAYVKQEVEFYGLQPPIIDGRVSLRSYGVSGLTPHLFHNEMRLSIAPLTVPVMYLDNSQLIFSLTPFHLQGYYLPIQRAKGRVLCLGLGMGYYALRVAAKPEVEEVVVVESSSDVIRFFENHVRGEANGKIRMVQADAYGIGTPLETGRGFDFCFCSIYPVLYSSESIRDVRIFKETYNTRQYHFFGMERLIMECLANRILRRYETPLQFREFMNLWKTFGLRFQPILNDGILREFRRVTVETNLLQWEEENS